MPRKTGGGGSTPAPKYTANPRPAVRPGAKVKGVPGSTVSAARNKGQMGTLASGGKRQAKKVAARKTIRKVTRAAVRKGISGPTEDSLGITRNEGGRAVRKAVKTLGTEKATKVATKTRLRRGQTYVGGRGWVSTPSKKRGK